MALLSAIPAELLSAASQLEGISTSLTSQNAAAAAPTTTISPAAADQVSLLQAGIFGAYGTLYQQIAAEASQVQQQFVQTLGLSSNTYTETEAINAADAANPLDDLSTTLTNVATFLGGPLTSSGGNPFSFSGNAANFLSYETGNWASAMSCLIGMAGGGLVPTDWWPTAAAAADVGVAADAVDTTTPLGAGGGGVSAAAGEATMVGNMSAPPSWATAATPVSSTGVGAIQGATLTSAAPAAGAGGLVPGMPGMATGRNSGGFGAPRYGIKPIVMKKLGLAAVAAG